MNSKVFLVRLRCDLRGVLCIAAAVVAGLWSSPVAAQSSPAIWGLRTRDVFSCNMVTTRETQLTFGEQPATVLKSRDFLRLEYRVESVEPNGDAVLVVRIQEPQREAGGEMSRTARLASGALSRLANMTIRFRVDPFGVVSAVSPAGHREFLTGVAGTDEAFQAFLRAACPEEVYSSWLGRPFLFPQREMIVAGRQPWTASLTDSVGAFGLLRSSLTLKPELLEDDAVVVTISGQPEFSPLVLPSSSSAPEDGLQLPIRALTIESGKVSGRAQQRRRQAAANPQDAAAPLVRPPFDLMEITLEVTGTGQLDEASAGLLPGKAFQFRHSSRCSLLITGFAFSENLRRELPVVPAEPQ